MTAESIRKGIENLEKAIPIDSNYAPGYAALADCYSWLAFLTSSTAPNEVYPKAKKAALRAVDLDSELAEAHASLAQIKFYFDWDWQGAEGGIQACHRAKSEQCDFSRRIRNFPWESRARG